jgi:hypothetical protein
MNDNNFEIPITYKGKEINFPASLVTYGYTYKIVVNVYGILISFEPDEERNFRAIVNWDDLHETNNIDKELLKEIAAAIESITK